MNKAFVLLGFAFVAGCTSLSGRDSTATAQLSPKSGSNVSGKVTFTQRGDVVLVAADVKGLTPGPHGFHVHEKGDCSADDASSAGGHFNPTGKPHGHPLQGEHHAGDMPMLEADASGNARLTGELRDVTLGDGPNSIVGRAVVVHAARDDYKSQPAGDSGARVACGVVRKD